MRNIKKCLPLQLELVTKYIVIMSSAAIVNTFRKTEKSKIRRQLPEQRHLSWENIQKLFPDRFVLLENPVFKVNSPILTGGILRYKNRSIDKVIEVANQLSLNHQTVKYTGGKLDETDINFIL
jgi:hypothetical protein